MSDEHWRFARLSEQDLISRIRDAKSRVVLIAPTITKNLARAFCEHIWNVEDLKFAAIIGSDRETMAQAFRCLAAMDKFNDQISERRWELKSTRRDLDSVLDAPIDLAKITEDHIQKVLNDVFGEPEKETAATPSEPVQADMVLFDNGSTMAYSHTPIGVYLPRHIGVYLPRHLVDEANAIIHPGSPETFLKSIGEPPESTSENAPEEALIKHLKRVIQDFASQSAKKVAGRVIRKLKKLPPGLSGDDSGLNSVWEEIVVQVQGSQSFFWGNYDEIVEQLICAELEVLTPNEKDAIWLQTDAELDWELELEDDQSSDPPIYLADIVDFVKHEHVYEAAVQYENSRVEKYLDR